MTDFKKLRENFGLFTTGVAVASTVGEKDNKNFITINSLSSVSLDPALLLFCIDNKSTNFEAFVNSKSFAINLLTKEQQDISTLFAKPEKDRAHHDLDELFFKSRRNNFILNDSLGYFECERQNVVKAGDHRIIIGKIENFAKINPDKKPLLYYKGSYNSL